MSIYAAKKDRSSWRAINHIDDVQGDEDYLETQPELIPTQAEIEAQGAEAQYKQDAQNAKQYAKLQALSSLTPAQIQSWVQANVNTLADAKDALKTLAVAVGILARRL